MTFWNKLLKLLQKKVDIGREVILRKKFPLKAVCDALGVSRSNMYQNKKPRPQRYKMKEDEEVLAEIRKVAKDRST